ncbi:MAG TPA: hypothetical protein GXX40_10155 [Firmicutes bacterium]|nr:hypothetical protein [Bacillota bacterium]
MTIEEYLDELARKYEPSYDVQRDVVLGGKTIDMLATSIRRTEKYFLLKELPLYGFDTCCISLIQVFREPVTSYHVKEFSEYIQSVAFKLANPSLDKLCTIINGVMVCGNKVYPEVPPTVRATRWSRAFAFGLKGYVHLGMLLVDLGSKEVVTNKIGNAFRMSHLALDWR